MFEPLNLGPGVAYLWIFVADNCHNFRTLWYSQLHCSSLRWTLLGGLHSRLALLPLFVGNGIIFTLQWALVVLWTTGHPAAPSFSNEGVTTALPLHSTILCETKVLWTVFSFFDLPLVSFLSWSNPNDRGNLSAMVQQCAIKSILKLTIFCPNSWKYNLHQQIEFVAKSDQIFLLITIGHTNQRKSLSSSTLWFLEL